MDAKDLRIETALGERNDGSKYSQSGVTLQCNRNKSYQDIGSNPLAKAEVAVRPCAVIGPDRVVMPPVSNDTYLKKAVDLWPCSEYYKQLNNDVNPSRNISPRQTFQENMQRIMVPPTYSAVKHAEESNLNHVQDKNAALPKNSKQTMAPEAKYCDVPYTVNLLTNEHKNVREAEMCAPGVNSPLTRAAQHGWLPNGAMHSLPRAYGQHDMYQYPQYPSCAGPGASAVPMMRHRTFQEGGSYVYPDSHYQDASVRFKPYPTVKERYPQARYDYVSNYQNPFHPPPPYAPHKYDIPNVRPPQPYQVYPHLKYLDNRVSDPNIEGYQRPNQQSISYNMQFRNQIIHPPYAPVLGNTQNKLPLYPPDKSANKLTLDTSKAYVNYENAKAKYSLPDNYFVSEMGRVHQVQKQVTLPSYASPGMQPVPLPQYHRKDHMAMKNYEYMPHYRHFEHPLGYHHQPQFSPSTLAISPTDSNTSNDTAITLGTSQDDCGYVSQSSATSARSVDRLHNDYHRRYDYRYRPIVGNSQMLPKPEMTSSNSKENNKINVRQFLSMWSEGDEDNSNSKEISIPNNYSNQENAKSHDQLYVLGLVNVPSEELAKYEHIQKVSKLPENIKGYNSIELLNQFEEVIESSNINSFQTSTPKEYMPIKDRKNAIKQIVEVLPRPISPLDVEAKISQSIIHKEVGCNFEIKPCSPKMLNVEIAAPVQNILGERAIEKVSNPLSNKVKSPSSMRTDVNTACNKTQRQDSTHSTYENISCKMIGSPFTANRMESVKSNYNLQDLETSSGVCLASLPRLDNEIELSFPEVNQQFINANKVSRNFFETYPEEIKDDNQKLNSLTENNENHNDSNRQTGISLDETYKENTKLSKFRINKLNSSEYKEDESNANAIRTDSVIIENPDNVRKNEDSKEKTSSLRSFSEENNTPINLTSQNNSHLDSESGTAAEYALDFSLNKSEDGLPLFNACDNELINTVQKETLLSNVVSYDDNTENAIQHSNSSLGSSSERTSMEPNTNSIIVRNNQSATNECKSNLTDNSTSSLVEEKQSSPQSLDRSDNNSINQIVSNVTCVNDGYKMQLDSNETNTLKSSSSNVIVKHKHKNKFKSSKAKKHNVLKCNSAKEPIVKKENNRSPVDAHSDNNPLMPVSKDYERISNITQSVIQNHTLSGEHLKMASPVSNIHEDENSEINSAVNNIICKSSFATQQNYIIVQDQINNDISVNNETDGCSKVNIKDKDICKDLTQKSIFIDIDRKKEDDDCYYIDKNVESNSTTDQNDKCGSDSIIESEIITDKSYCPDTLKLSKNSLPCEEDTSVHNIILTEVDVSNDKGKNITKVDNTYNQGFENNKNTETVVDTSTMRPDVEFCVKSEIEVEYRKISTPDDEVNLRSLDTEMFKDSDEVSTLGCENASNIDNSLSDKIKIVDMETTNLKTSNIRKQLNANAKVHLNKKCSTDSGYQSSKNSFADNDDANIEFPGNQTEDSVFIEHIKPGQITSSDNFTINEPTSPLSQNFISTSTAIELVNTVNENEKSANLEKRNIKTNTIELDDIDANMEMIFAQPYETKLPESVNNHNINLNLETSDVLNPSETMEIDVNNVLAQAKKNILSNSTGIKDFMVADKPFAESLNKAEKDTEIMNTLCFYKHGCNGKMLHSPWIQKLLLFNEGNIKSKFESPMNGTNISDIAVVDNYIRNVDIVNSNSNITMKNVVLGKDLDLKSLHESKIESISDKSEEDVDNLFQNVGVKSSNGNITMDRGLISANLDQMSLQESKVKSPIHDTDIGDKTNINSVIHNIDVKSLIANITMDSALISNDLELMSLQQSKNESPPMHDTDMSDKTNIVNFIQKVDVNSTVEDIIMDSVIKDKNLDLKSLQESKVNSPMHNTDIDNKVDIDGLIHNVGNTTTLLHIQLQSLIESNINIKQTVNSTENASKASDNNIQLQSLIESNINITQTVNSIENASKESDNNDVVILLDKSKSDNENILQSEDNTQYIKRAHRVENDAIGDKLLEIANVDSDTKNHNIEDNSLEMPTISTVLKNDNLDYRPLDDTQSVVNDDIIISLPLHHDDVDDFVEKSLEKPIQTGFKSVVQNEELDNDSFRTPIIDNVSKDEEINSFDIKLVNNIEKIDTFSSLNLKENESLQGSHLKIDLNIDRVNTKTNTSHLTNSSNDELTRNISTDLYNEMDSNSRQEKNDKINEEENSLLCKDNKSDVSDEKSINYNDSIKRQDITFNYPNNSVISQITENVFHTDDNVIEFKCQENNDEDDTKYKINNEHCAPISHRRSLKRSLSDSVLNRDVKDKLSDLHYSWASKRNRVNEFENDSLNNRRNSINVEENVSFCILIDDNCIVTEENEDKICIAELQEEYVAEIDTGNDGENADLLNGMDSRTHARSVDYSESVVLEYEDKNAVQDTWVEDIACGEEVFSDEVAENVVISAPSSPSDSASDYEHEDINIYGSSTCSHIDKVKLIHGDKMSEGDAQIVETLYRTPHMHIMNKTLLYGDKTVESDIDQDNILIESDDWKPSPTHTPDYIDPSSASNDFRLETPENKENVLVKGLSPLRRIDDYLDSSSADNETDEHSASYHDPVSDSMAQDVYSCESSLDNVLDYKPKDESISTTTPKTSASSPEVSSTTSEDKNSGILLKITNLNGSRVSQINEIQITNRPRCKFTEKKEYCTSNLNFPNRPLMTKAAQKYIPPIKDSIRDLKVKITLPQQSLLKLKQLKLSRNEPKVYKQQSSVPRIIKKPKPNFDDVLKSIDEIQIKRHKEKSKKNKSVVPKVLIKKNENGSHYASTPKKDIFSPDLTGRKWQPWVFIEKNHFIDKMAIKNKTKAMFSHRKKTYVLAEKFKKYKSASSAKFVISQPRTPGQLKCTIRLKNST